MQSEMQRGIEGNGRGASIGSWWRDRQGGATKGPKESGHPEQLPTGLPGPC